MRLPLDPSVIRGAILRLNLSRCPSAVARLVVAIPINAIERLALWALTHVRQKVGETTAGLRVPPIADSDSAGTVQLVGPIPDIEASTTHRFPTAIGARVGHPVPLPSEILLLGTSRPNLRLRFIGMSAAQHRRRIVPRGEGMASGLHCRAAAAATGERLIRDSFVMPAEETRPPVSSIRARGQSFAAPALTERPREHVPSKEEWCLIAK